MNSVLRLSRRQGDADYIGEKISQLEHCLQAASQAVEAGKCAPADADNVQ